MFSYFNAGRRPSGQFCRSKNLGLTIVELMISIVLLGTTLALALPSYTQMIEKRQLSQGAEQIHAFLNSMQILASRSQDAVTVSYSRTANDDWCFGAVIGDAACDCTETNTAAADYCSIDNAPALITNEHLGNIGILQSVTGDGSYSFDPTRGILADLDDALDVELFSPGGEYQLRLLVSNTGHSTLCSKDQDHAMAGYKPCPTVEEGEPQTDPDPDPDPDPQPPAPDPDPDIEPKPTPDPWPDPGIVK